MEKSFDEKKSETLVSEDSLRKIYEMKMLELKSKIEDDMTLEEFLRLKVNASDIKENPDGSLSFSIS